MSYQALYRKFRPQTFDEVKGQDAVVTTLKNQIIHDRVGHAYIFTGTRGTGKTSIAKLFAKAVNCENPQQGSPCMECESCKKIQANTSMSVIEMDAASNNGVEDVRRIEEEIAYSPTDGKYRVYIVDEVHMFSTAAFNALLKTLEEPPAYVIFILATTEVHKLPVTIMSRCQRYDFRRIDIPTIAARMKELTEAEGVRVEDRALQYIARCADGSMRDGLSLLDQCIAFYLGEELTYDKALEVLGAVDTQVFSQMLRYIVAVDVSGAIRLLDEIVMKGRELTQFVLDFTWYMRNLLLVKSAEEIEDVVDISTEHRIRLSEDAESVDDNALMRYIRLLSELSVTLRNAAQKRVQVELTLIRMCKPQMETDMSSILDRIRQLEEKSERMPQVIYQSPAQGGAVAAAEPAEKPKLPEALPEDIQKVRDNWGFIIGALPPMIKNFGKLIEPSIENDRLILVCSEPMHYEMLSTPEKKADFKAVIDERIGKDVEFEIRLLPENKSFDSVYPRVLDRSKINFDILDEDEVSEEDIPEELPVNEETAEPLEDSSFEEPEEDEDDDREEFLEDSELQGE